MQHEFWTRIEKHPPILLRLLARIPRARPLESTEIAERSGLTLTQVEAISQQTDWRGIDLLTARAFMAACGCDLSDRATYHRIRIYLKTAPKKPLSRFPYLRRSARWETYYLPLLERFVKHLKAQRN